MSYSYQKNAFRASLPASVFVIDESRGSSKSRLLSGAAIAFAAAGMPAVASAEEAPDTSMFLKAAQPERMFALGAENIPEVFEPSTATVNLEPSTVTVNLEPSAAPADMPNFEAEQPLKPTAQDSVSAFSIQVDENREVTEASQHNVQVRVDTLHVQPVISVGLVEAERTVVRGSEATFIGYTNYPALIDKAEVRVFEDGRPSDGEPYAIAPMDASGAATWTAPADAPEALYYVYRVYDGKGRFDETLPEELTLLNEPIDEENPAPSRPEFGLIDEANIRNISTSNTAAIVVTGLADPLKDEVRVSGQPIPVDENGKFATRQIVYKDAKKVDVQISRGAVVTQESVYNIDVPKSDWFFIGQGDLTFISSNGSGPAVDVSGDITALDDNITSRAAFYLSGKFGDGWKLTSSLDTGEVLLEDLFSNIDRKNPRQLLRRLDSNEFYPTYGDDSTLIEDAPTQTGFYARLEKDDSSLIVGNFIANFQQAELAQLDRGLFGGLIDYKSNNLTDFGERKLQLTAFASDPGTLPARDEFRGTGGSLYFLNRQDLTIGSERIRIETRDRETGLVLSSTELRPQEDYNIDYFQGRVTLSRPLASVVSDGATVRQGSSAGNIPVLVVRYEFTPVVGDLDGYTVATRGVGWIGNFARLGVTSQKETTETANQTLLAADLLLRHSAGTYFKAEIARTEGPGFGQSNSVDGGLNFVNIATPALVGQSADAFRTELAIDFAELAGKDKNIGRASAYFEHFDAGFSSNSQLTFSDTQRWGVFTELSLGKSTQIQAKYDQLSTDLNGSSSAATADIVQKLGKSVNARLGLRRDERSPGQLFNSVQDGTRTDAALQVDYNPESSNWSAYTFGQLTLEIGGRYPTEPPY